MEPKRGDREESPVADDIGDRCHERTRGDGRIELQLVGHKRHDNAAEGAGDQIGEHRQRHGRSPLRPEALSMSRHFGAIMQNGYVVRDWRRAAEWWSDVMGVGPFFVMELVKGVPITEYCDRNELPAEERLRQFIHAMLGRLLDDGHLGCHARLIAREIADPTGALDDIAETLMRPRFLLLQDIVERYAGPGWAAADIERLMLCILGQCLVYRHSRPLIER